MSDLLVCAVGITLALVILGILFSVVRLLQGPSLPDRVVALDLVSVLLIAFIAAFSVRNNDPMFLNVGLALGLTSFLSTVAFARYIGRRPASDKAAPVPIKQSFADWGEKRDA